MAYDVLKRLELDGRLKDCCITISRDGGLPLQILGKDITGVSRSSIAFLGGESGREELSASLERVESISMDCENAFRRKSRISRILPRGGRR